MPVWLPVVVTLVIASITVALQFYFKLVPDPSDIRRHLKVTAAFVVDVGLLGLQGVCLYQVAHGPTTSMQLFEVGFSAAGLAFGATVVCAKRLVSSSPFRQFFELIAEQGQYFDRHLDHFGQLIEIVRRHREALLVLAGDPNVPTELAERLRAVLSITDETASIGNMRRRRPERSRHSA